MPARSRYGCVDPTSPAAAGRCDIGTEIVQRSTLRPVMRWAGNRLVATGLLSCPRHMDLPNAQDRTLVLPPDPPSIHNPRPDIDGASS